MVPDGNTGTESLSRFGGDGFDVLAPGGRSRLAYQVSVCWQEATGNPRAVAGRGGC